MGPPRRKAKIPIHQRTETRHRKTRLADEVHQMLDWLIHLKAHFLQVDEFDWLIHLNTPEYTFLQVDEFD